jgi:hypothetical protein
MVEWETYVPDTRWNVGFETLTLSHLSTEYVLVPLQVTKAGVPYNPTSDTLQFAFMPNSVQVPVTADWVAGAWESVPTNIIYPYNAKCLVGPTGTTVLTLGTYVMYLKITDSPEVPVLIGGQLVIS